MNKFIFFLLFIGSICAAQNKRPILMKFDTTLGVGGNNNRIFINTEHYVYASDYQYTYQKEGSSIVSDLYDSNNGVIDLPTSGIYTIAITPKTEGFYMTLDSNHGNTYPEKLIELMQWGDYDWLSFYNTFYNCKNLKITATDIPKTMQTLSCSGMFINCESITNIPNIENWDLSNMEDMAYMFYGAVSFNQNIGMWDVSNLKDMAFMFGGATSFNQNIGMWNVSNMINMHGMFSEATSFNQDIGDWDVSKVTEMQNMFSGATSFNKNIGNWDVSSVLWMNSMFMDATAFNQNIGKWKLNNNASLLLIVHSAGLSCQNYALTLKGWAENPSTPTNRNLGATNVKYGTVGKTYRDLLTTQKGWTFSGDIFEPSCNDALSTNENSLSEKLNFYPNPTTGRVFYQSKTDESLHINNTAGQLLKTVKVTKGANQIDVSEFPKGVYFLKAGIKTSKLLKN